MCRADVAPEAVAGLAALLDAMAARLAEEHGADRQVVLIGPVDFGEETAAVKAP